jgi:signal transduction histidine kinase
MLPGAAPPHRAVRVLRRTTVDTFISEYTATIQEQTERIKALNRSASHELRSLRSLAEEVSRQLQLMAAARSVLIRIADDLPTLQADPARLELVLLNLLSNAIKYSDPDKDASFVEVVLAPTRRPLDNRTNTLEYLVPHGRLHTPGTR